MIMNIKFADLRYNMPSLSKFDYVQYILNR